MYWNLGFHHPAGRWGGGGKERGKRCEEVWNRGIKKREVSRVEETRLVEEDGWSRVDGTRYSTRFGAKRMEQDGLTSMTDEQDSWKRRLA